MNLDPNIYKKNYAALQKRYPDLALLLSMVEIKRYKLVKADNCMANVMVDGQYYYLGNLPRYCEESFKGLKLKNVKIPVFCGFGLGYEIHYWMQTKAKEYASQAIIIFEKDVELFQCAMNVTDIRPIIENPHIHLFVGLPLEKLYPVLRQHFVDNLQELLMCGATQPVFLYPAMRMNKEYYMRVVQTYFEAAYHAIQNFGNCPEDSLIGLENMLDNVGEIVRNPGINLLYDKFKGKPAVIVATGPSLKKNMHLLKGLEDKALIIACDSSLKLLMQNGIKPHMVASLEREHEVQQFFEGFEPEDVKDVYMTACPVLYNHVYEAYNGPKIIVYRNFDHFKWLEIDRGILNIKLSSANMAFKIAEALGCDPIILVGQDLAYGPDGETHATKVPFSAEGEAIFDVKGNIADMVKTNSGWYSFLKAFEVDIAEHSGRVINCTEGGAYIPGTTIAPFQDAIDKYITNIISPLDTIHESLQAFTTAGQDMERLREHIAKTETDVRAIIDLCILGAETCKKYEQELKGELTPERLNEIRIEIITPRLKLQAEYADTFQQFLMHVCQSVHLKFEMECAMLHTKPADILLQFVDWYSYIGDISEICLQSLVKSKEKLYAGI
jgi:hypothetical protein